jgi:hypothetical protein
MAPSDSNKVGVVRETGRFFPEGWSYFKKEKRSVIMKKIVFMISTVVILLVILNVSVCLANPLAGYWEIVTVDGSKHSLEIRQEGNGIKQDYFSATLYYKAENIQMGITCRTCFENSPGVFRYESYPKQIETVGYFGNVNGKPAFNGFVGKLISPTVIKGEFLSSGKVQNVSRESAVFTAYKR